MGTWEVHECLGVVIIKMSDEDEITLPYGNRNGEWVKGKQIAIAREIVAAVNFCRAINETRKEKNKCRK